MASKKLKKHLIEYPDDIDAPDKRTEVYCVSRLQDNARSARARLTCADLPWSQLPQYIPSRTSARRFDPHDGVEVPPSAIYEAEIVLSTFINFCRTTRERTVVSSGLDFARIVDMPRIMLILNSINHHSALEKIIQADLTDQSLPLATTQGEMAWKELRNEEWFEKFEAEQYRMYPRDWSHGIHLEIGQFEPLPFNHVRKLGSGSQGSVDEVEFVTRKHRLARKHWSSTRRDTRRRLAVEVALLSRLDPQRHIIDITGSYSRGNEFGLLHNPIAEADLWEALSLPIQERRQLISDNDMRLALGCLSVAVAHIHENKIRHKDIKAANILVSKGSFVFTDFGLSLDITDFTNSITTGGQGTRKYRAPELSDPMMEGRRAPADIFALGCILMEIWSVLAGWSVESQESFTNFSPYYENLVGVQDWIQQIMESIEHGSLINTRPDVDESDLLWLQLCSGMLNEDPDQRTSIVDVIGVLKSGPGDFYCCAACQAWTADFVSNNANPQESVTPITEMLGALRGDSDSDSDSLYEAPPPRRTQTGHLGTRQSLPTLQRTPSPVRAIQTSTTVIPDEEPRITFIDSLNRKFRFAYELCKSWETMELLIRDTVPITGHDTILAAVVRGQYDLKNADGEVILPRLWGQTLRPNTEIRLELWPSAIPDTLNSKLSLNAEKTIGATPSRGGENHSDTSTITQQRYASTLPLDIHEYRTVPTETTQQLSVVTQPDNLTASAPMTAQSNLYEELLHYEANRESGDFILDEHLNVIPNPQRSTASREQQPSTPDPSATELPLRPAPTQGSSSSPAQRTVRIVRRLDAERRPDTERELDEVLVPSSTALGTTSSRAPRTVRIARRPEVERRPTRPKPSPFFEWIAGSPRPRT